MKATNYACFKLEEETTESVKKNKNNFINVRGDEFAISIRQEKLTTNNVLIFLLGGWDLTRGDFGLSSLFQS